MDELLLVAETILFVVGLLYLYPRDKLFGLYFVFLFVYAIFAQIGYRFYPEASDSILAYFGEDVWRPCTLFIMASLAMFVLGFIVVRPIAYALMPVRLEIRRAALRDIWKAIGLLWLFASAAFMLGYLALNGGDLSWYSAQQDDLATNAPALALLIFLVKLEVGTLIVLYQMAREKARIFSWLNPWAVFVVRGTLFLVLTFMLGNRTDILACFLGIVLMTLSQTTLSPRFLLRAMAAALAVVSLMLVIEATRYNDAELPGETPLSQRLLVKDYYPPAHMLFAAAAYDEVDPDEVIASNAANAAVMFGYPYLQETVTNLFRPDLATRSVGYAFYVLTEGFLFMGYWGFLYNGLILTIALTLWRRLASSDSRAFNLLLLGLFGCMLVNVVRGQSSYFIKYLYTFVFPNALLYLSLIGARVRIRFGNPPSART
ncbi:hypothetical protein PI87_10225 [Ralstonia sp. A12]|uniref:hypothetical protein n=1 Tax=Ralstonia sp. A12 TaxID=1217052 RepID=UPI0005750A71|nr:hypothetical protein [Ralstonia sp. A12]KHK56106.1 hypothetical protein PI87_10225 [Ralstonia sp. A12]